MRIVTQYDVRAWAYLVPLIRDAMPAHTVGVNRELRVFPTTYCDGLTCSDHVERSLRNDGDICDWVHSRVQEHLDPLGLARHAL